MAASRERLEHEARLPWRAGYYPTVWPSEHTDLWRSHAVADAGLPVDAFADGKQPTLRVSTSRLNLPVWGYTRDADQVFVVGGSPVVLEAFTQAMLGRGLPNPIIDPGEHLASVPYVARIDPITMDVISVDLTEGHTINYTGGLLMHADGFVYAVAQSVLYKIDPVTMRAVAVLHLPLVGAGGPSGLSTTYNGLQVVESGRLLLKGFSLFGDEKIEGWLLQVDASDLSIVVQQAEILSSARMTVEQSPDGPTYLYLINEMESRRYQVEQDAFVPDRPWTAAYRDENSKSTQASSPLLFGKIGQSVFADNTAPGAKTPIQLYSQLTTKDRSPGRLDGTPAFDTPKPGYNFFMVAGDPFERQIVVYYDPINRLMSAHLVIEGGGFEPIWNRDGCYFASASPAIVHDRDLLYIDDYRDGRDHLVILRLSTGEQLASVALDAKLPTIGTIFVGMNDDVFLISSEAGTANGLVSRVTLAPDQPI